MRHRLRHPWLHRIAWLRRNRCSVLLVAVCLLILANPLFGSTLGGHKALSVVLLLILLLATWALRVRRAGLLAVLALALVSIAVVIVVPSDEHWLRPVANGTMALFTGAVTVALLRYVLDWHLITTDKVFGAVAAYVLIAIAFACLFCMLQYIETKAFYIAQPNDPDGRLSWSDSMYFSFTVLTSTGFGEITPVTDMARSLIVIEQVLGVMYVAFLVARLANLYGLNQRR
jgi:Ion channel